MALRGPCGLAAAVLAGLAVAGGAAAQGGNAADTAGQKELYNYVLTMDKIQKLGHATKALEDLSKKHPEYSGISGSKTLDEMDHKMGALPDVVSALAADGLKPREYAVGMMALVQAAMAVGFKKSGTYKDYPPDMLKLVSKANLAFVEQHWDQIQSLTKGAAPER